MYIDGVNAGRTDRNVTLNLATPTTSGLHFHLTLGGLVWGAGSANAFQGAFSEVRVYLGLLTSQQIKTAYLTNIYPTAGLQAYYPLREKKGILLRDYSRQFNTHKQTRSVFDSRESLSSAHVAIESFIEAHNISLLLFMLFRSFVSL